ncbi:hypothetical protein AAC387_Pa06g1213 [Persea americana]
MLQDGSLVPDSYLFPTLLKACAMIHALSEGTQIHASAIKLQFIADTYVQNALIKFYCECRRIGDARKVFDKMSERSDVSWNCIVGGYAELGCWEDVKVLFWSMVEQFSVAPSFVVLVRMLNACTRSGDYHSGRRVHRYIEENGVGLSLNLGNALMNMYVKFGEMGVARQLFFRMPDRDVVSWTTLVSGYAGLGCLKASREIFDTMPERNVVTWNAMISGYVHNACFKEAVLLFEEMLVLDVKPDKATIVSLLSACAVLGDLLTGRTIHGYIEKVCFDPTLDLSNSLLGMYSKCRSMDSAECLFETMAVRNEVTWTLLMAGYVKCGEKEVALEIFNKMPCKDAISWNALIAAFSQCNYFKEALGLFQEMQKTEFSSNALTLVSIVSVCARVGSLELGKWAHSFIDRNNIEMDAHLGSSLIDMERIDRTKQLAVGFGITSTDREMPKKLFKALEDCPERERIDRTKQLAVGFGITSTDREMPKKLFKALEDCPGWERIDRTKQLAVGFGITSTDREMPKKLFKALEDCPGCDGNEQESCVVECINRAQHDLLTCQLYDSDTLRYVNE